VKFFSYFPYKRQAVPQRARVGKRQAAKAGIAFEALDNGFAAVEDPAALQGICDRLGPEQIDAVLRKWLAILPHPFSSEDRAAGYRYDISILQAEFPDPDAGQTRLGSGPFRAGHPRQPRHRPPRLGQSDLRPAANAPRAARDTGPVPDPGDHHRGDPEPARGLQTHHDQAVPQGRTSAAHSDHDQQHSRFGIGKRLTNLPALREIGFFANRRLLRVQRFSCDPITGADALATITGTLTTATGIRVPGLRFAEQRSHALLSALLVFRCHPNGFTNKDLRALTAELRGLDPGRVSPGQMTYDLRRLKTRNLITRIEGSHRHRVTDHGLDTAKFLTCVHDRVLRTGLAELATPEPTPGHLKAAATAYRTAIDTLTAAAQLAA
jgi:hypothetical protein